MFIQIIDFVFYRKEVKDPDVLYNMLKNLLAQIKVRLSLSLRPAGPKHTQQRGVRGTNQDSLQTHPDAWPFMEPVKKSEAPDYYEIIRFPIGW